MNDESLLVLPVDRDEQLATRAAWLYFVAGLTQAQIGKKLGINRIRVNRLLAQAREQGMVQIRITGRLADCVALENRLTERFGLDQAIIVPTPPDPALVRHVIGAAAGSALAERLKDGMSVGVGWGRTLRLSLRSVPRRPLRRVSVVSLMGGLTRGAAVNPHETASHLADLIDAQCYYIAAPALADTEATRDLLAQQPMLRDVFDRLRKVDLVLVSAGGLAADSTINQVDLISAADAGSLKEAGAVGDLCAHWLDIHGRLVDHPLNKRAVGLSPLDLKAVPCVIVASGGADKVDVLHGALEGGMVDILITDEATASGILATADRVM
ncbi:sugar-binding transcriptional regulator [Nordella sp. HKS 07]|uniref:sugar-binding transcriptional regulator n=1 Tax=Nordella sp. HKS 07 TaxID=2712222 RepID=UPI0013E17A32|nr:sugar-binding transcriptional regulator [Nordella sp. HKS 07]QIG47906.1 sugar-binding transcriptional regulator [Nordella sp. HKS 07]